MTIVVQSVVVYCLWLLCTLTNAKVLPSILWSPENPLFHHLGSSARKVMPFDKLPIMCPNLINYPIIRDDVYLKDLLYENLFLVDKQGFDSCNATSGLKILSCEKPDGHATVVFQPNSANDNDPTFQEGHEYYFINTASGLVTSLANLEGGRCKDNKMKMKIYVCKGENDPKCPHGHEVRHGGWSDWSECTGGGLQSRQCNNPYPENGGLPCFGDTDRPCSSKASQTLGCRGSSCSTNTEATRQPEIPSKDTQTGDKLNEDEMLISKGIFAGICVITLVAGLVIGGVLAMLLCRFQRQKKNNNVKITRVPSALSTARPISTFSLASETSIVRTEHSQ